MALQIITADQRAAQKGGTEMVIFGPAGIGKTSLVKTMPAATTLFVDMEAGMKAVDDWPGDSINVRSEAAKMGMHPWDFLKGLACLISGPSPAVAAGAFSQQHYDMVSQALGTREQVLGKYETVFFDSITETGRYSFGWCKQQPESFNKDGKPDTRGAYGLHGQELVGANGIFNQLKHCQDKNIVLVGVLEHIVDDYGRKAWQPQLDGGKAMRELPGILDEVISFIEIERPDGQPSYRAFICQTLNPWGVPAKDRSGHLDMIEEPHLGKLLEKLNTGKRKIEMVTALPDHTNPADHWAQQPQPHTGTAEAQPASQGLVQPQPGSANPGAAPASTPS